MDDRTRRAFKVVENAHQAADQIAKLIDELDVAQFLHTHAVRNTYDAITCLRMSIEDLWEVERERTFGPGGLTDQKVRDTIGESLGDRLSGMRVASRNTHRVVNAIAEGRVTITDSSEHIITGRVKSDSGNTYQVASTPNGAACECQAGKHSRPCWHLAALELKEAAVNLGIIPDREEKPEPIKEEES